MPTPANPLVYHLYGLEDYPQSLVLSEEDYLNFLIRVTEDTNVQNPIVPLVLRRALADSQLLLLGYRKREWDFRVLLKFLSKHRRMEFTPPGLIVQLKERIIQSNEERSLHYLEQYFERNRFKVAWGTYESFINTLWNEWQKYFQGQS